MPAVQPPALLFFWTMDPARAPIQNDRVVARRAGDKVIILDPKSGEYFTLEEVGARIWELCDGERTPDQIAEVVAQEYDAPLAQVAADVAELLDDLADNDLVTS